jgi:hypothetical protein
VTTTSPPIDVQYDTYQKLLREKYLHEWTLSEVLGRFKATPTEKTLAEAGTVMAEHVVLETKLAAAAAVCGIAHGRAK